MQRVDNDDREMNENSSDEWQSEDVDEDDLVNELTSHSSGDFSPFPNKQFAMLYLLLHGPHPIVSNVTNVL